MWVVTAAMAVVCGLGTPVGATVVKPMVKPMVKPEGKPVGEPVVVRGDAEAKDAAEAALVIASRARKAAYGLEGEARRAALLAAAGRYSDVADDATAGAAARAEGAFRAGEILRSQDELDQARSRFEQAAGFGDQDEARAFAARGLLEQAHLLRRDDDVEGALSIYDAVLQRFGSERRSAAHATTWKGKLLMRGGRHEEAVAVLTQFAEDFSEYPTEAVRNADLAAVGCMKDGDASQARMIVDRVRSLMEPKVDEGGRQAAAIVAALDAMKAPTLMEES
jgi:tetratricopeptide (TPR) repeat protein